MVIWFSSSKSYERNPQYIKPAFIRPHKICVKNHNGDYNGIMEGTREKVGERTCPIYASVVVFDGEREDSKYCHL